MDIMANGDISPCCFFYAEDAFYTPISSLLLDYWKSPQLLQLQEDVLSGKRVSACEYCYQLDDAGIKSPRVQAIQEYGVSTKNEVYDLTLRFSNNCNLACRTCNTFCSTGWFEDAKKIGPKIKTEHHTLKKQYPNMHEEFEKVLPQLKIIHLLGGEPLMDQEHKQLVHKAIAEQPQVKIEYNTNLSLPLERLPEVTQEWSSIKNLILTLSVDGVGRQGEYLRHGLEWNIFEKNLDYIITNLPHAQLYFTITVSILNIFHLADIFAYLADKKLLERIRLNINPVNNPPYLNIQALPEVVKQQVVTFYKQVIDDFPDLAQKCQELMDYMLVTDRSDQLLNFFVMTQYIDRLRGQSYLELFPELTCLREHK